MPMNRETAQADRAAMYAQWLRDDVDGLAHNIAGLALTKDDEFKVLRDARGKLAAAIQQIDAAINTNQLTRSVS